MFQARLFVYKLLDPTVEVEDKGDMKYELYYTLKSQQ